MKIVVSRTLKTAALGLFFSSLAFSSVKAAAITAVPVKLSWDSSPDPTVTGYTLYYGLANSTTNRVPLTDVESTLIPNLMAKSNYFFYVAAHNASGIESLPSNVLYYTPPAMTRLQLTKGSGPAIIRFRSAAGSACRVEYASSPNGTWQTLANTTANSIDGSVTVVDSVAGQYAKRFYRAVR